MPARRAHGMDQDIYPWSSSHWDWEVPPGTPLPVSPWARAGGSSGLLKKVFGPGHASYSEIHPAPND